MDREELKKSGLLDQYVLGLLSTDQAAEVETLIRQDPQLEGEVKRLRRDLNAYADAKQIGPPPRGRTQRTAADFQDLDHEMITAMMERNHSLNIWRYVLVAACLLLIALSGFLFRLGEQARGELVTERALHAQNVAANRHDLHRSRLAIEATAAHWKEVSTVSGPVDSGTVHIHLLRGAGVAMVDFSDVPPPPSGQAYYLAGGLNTEGEEDPIEITHHDMSGLVPVRVDEHHGRLSVYRWATGYRGERPKTDLPLLAIELLSVN